MLFRKIEDQSIITEKELRDLNPRTLFPATILNSHVNPLGYETYYPTDETVETPEQTIANLTRVLDNHLDNVAKERLYNDRFTCALRAGYPGPFQEEALAFAQWMDECNFTGYSIIAQCKAGTRDIPTAEELIDAMPEMVWPDSPIPV